MFNTTEDAIGSPLPSQDESLGPYSPQAPGDPLHGLLALPSHSMPHHVTDFSSLFNSPAGTGSEILVLEGQDGSHVNLTHQSRLSTQSRFSRYTNETNGSLNPFEITSQVFRSSGTDQAWHSQGYEASSAQHVGAEKAHARSALNGLGNPDSLDDDDTAGFWQSDDVVADSTDQRAHEHESHFLSHHQIRAKSPVISHNSPHMSSQASARISSVKKAEAPISSSFNNMRTISLPTASAAHHRDSATKPSRATFATSSARSSSSHPASPPLVALRQQNGASPSSHYGEHTFDHQQMHGSWDAQSLSEAGSMPSPGQDSWAHSQVASTPAKASVGFDAQTPDHRKLASSIARLASAAALARSPGLADAGTSSGIKTQVPDRLSNPEMRTPRTFFNPSFDDDHAQ